MPIVAVRYVATREHARSDQLLALDIIGVEIAVAVQFADLYAVFIDLVQTVLRLFAHDIDIDRFSAHRQRRDHHVVFQRLRPLFRGHRKGKAIFGTTQYLNPRRFVHAPLRLTAVIQQHRSLSVEEEIVIPDIAVVREREIISLFFADLFHKLEMRRIDHAEDIFRFSCRDVNKAPVVRIRSRDFISAHGRVFCNAVTVRHQRSRLAGNIDRLVVLIEIIDPVLALHAEQEMPVLFVHVQILVFGEDALRAEERVILRRVYTERAVIAIIVTIVFEQQTEDRLIFGNADQSRRVIVPAVLREIPEIEYVFRFDLGRNRIAVTVVFQHETAVAVRKQEGVDEQQTVLHIVFDLLRGAVCGRELRFALPVDDQRPVRAVEESERDVRESDFAALGQGKEFLRIRFAAPESIIVSRSVYEPVVRLRIDKRPVILRRTDPQMTEFPAAVVVDQQERVEVELSAKE